MRAMREAGRRRRQRALPLPKPQGAWRSLAACAHLDLPVAERLALFFAPYGERTNERKERDQKAREVCAVCPVINECTEAGKHEHGRWGNNVHEGQAAAALPPPVVRRLPVQYVWCEGCQSPFWTLLELRRHQLREACGRRKFVTG